MTTAEFKKIARLLKTVYAELERQAISEGISLLSPEYDQLTAIARERVLTNAGYTLQQYREAKAKVAGFSQADLVDETEKIDDKISSKFSERVEDILEKIEEIDRKHIPTEDEIESIAEQVAQKYIVPPQITNQIVKETVLEKPITIVEKYDDTELKKLVSELEIPEPYDDTQIRNEYKDYFSENFKKNIDTLGMPDFRKLAMGLQAQIDASGSGSGSGTVGPGTTNELAYFNAPTTIASLPVATYPSLTELTYLKGVTSAIQTQLNASGNPRLSKSYSFDTVPGTDSQAGIYYVSSGGGTIASDGGGYLISTGATNSAFLHIAFRNRYSDNVDGWGKNPELIFIANHSTKSTGSAVIQVTMSSNGNEALSDGTFTAAHMGFLICVVGGTRTVYATNANATTQTKTDVTGYFTAGTHQVYRAVMTSGTNIKFYIDGTLVATHTTNLPSTGWTSQGDIWNDSDLGTSANNALKLTHLEYSLDA